MDAERPARGDEGAEDGFEFAFHHGPQVGAGLEEILKIRGAPDQILPCAGHPEHVIAFAGPGHANPACVVSQFPAGLLCEKAVGDP